MLAVVVVIALAMRVVMVNQSVVEHPLSADAGEYYLYTVNMKYYGVYSRSRNILQDPQKINPPQPDAERTPGYAFFLYPFFEHPPVKAMFDNIVMVQALISSLTVLIAFLFYQSFLNWIGALLAAVLTTLSPHLIAANIYVLTETVFTFFLVCCVYAFSRLVANNNDKWAIAVGAFLGLTILVKPTMSYFIFFLVPALFVFYDRKQAVKIAVMLVAGCYVVYGPWIVRSNLNVEDSARSSKALASIHKGMYPNIMYQDDPETVGYPNHHDPGWKQRKDYSSVLGEIGRRFAEEPLEYTHWYLIGKPVTLLSWNMIVGMGDVYIYPVKTSPYFTSGFFAFTHQLMYWLHWPLVVMALFALVVVWLPLARQVLSNKQLLVAKFCSVVVFYFLVVHMAGLPLPRYAIPIKPIIYGLSMLGLHLLTDEAPASIARI